MKKLLLKNWKTTLFGIISVLLFCLVSFGVISPDQKDAINEGVNQVVTTAGSGSVMEIISSVMLVLGNLFLLFLKDPKKGDV